MTKWIKEIPQEPGIYWFYGDPFTLNKKQTDYAELHLVQVNQISNGLIFIATGHYMENKSGWWQIAQLPKLPKGEQ